MEIARPGHHQNVFVESQTAIQHDTEHFDLVGYRASANINPSMLYVICYCYEWLRNGFVRLCSAKAQRH